MREFLVNLLVCSVTMSALALVYIALTPVLSRRYSAKWRYYAWLVVVAGLVIPFRPSLGSAVLELNVPRNLPVVTIANDRPAQAARSDGSAYVYTNRAAENQAAEQTAEQVTVYSEPVNVVEEASAPEISVPLWQIAAAVWALGFAVYLVWHAAKHIRFIRTSKRWSTGPDDGEAFDIMRELKAGMNIERSVGLYRCSCISSPMVVGIFRPRILLPLAQFDEDELRFILRHELVHLKRRDLVYKAFVLFAGAVHWFNPAVYIMVRSIDQLCEISCDAETVAGHDPDGRLRYSETIIGVVKHQSRLRTPLSTNFYGGKKGMKERISSIMDMGRKRIGLTIVCTALAATICTGFVFAVASPEEKAEAPAETSETAVEHPTDSTTEAKLRAMLETNINAFLENDEQYQYLKSVAENLLPEIEPYKHLGISLDSEKALIMYEGNPVREINDTKLGKIIAETMGAVGFNYADNRDVAGAVDLTVVYQGDEPVGFKVSTPEEYDRRTEERLESSPGRRSITNIPDKWAFEEGYTVGYDLRSDLEGGNDIEEAFIANMVASYVGKAKDYEDDNAFKKALKAITDSDTANLSPGMWSFSYKIIEVDGPFTESPAELADKFYNENDVSKFYAVIKKVKDAAKRNELLNRAYADDRMDLAGAILEDDTTIDREAFGEKAFSDGKIDFFALVFADLSQAKLSELLNRSMADDDIIFTSILFNRVENPDYDTLGEQAYNNENLFIFAHIYKDMSQAKLRELFGRSLADQNFTFFQVMTYGLPDIDYDAVADMAYDNERMDFLAYACAHMSEEKRAELRQRAYNDRKDAYYAFLYSDRYKVYFEDLQDNLDDYFDELEDDWEDSLERAYDAGDRWRDALKNGAEALEDGMRAVQNGVEAAANAADDWSDSFLDAFSFSKYFDYNEPYTYTQNGYYQAPYIIEFGWNMPGGTADAYPAKADVTLSDGRKIQVSFAFGYEEYASDPAFVNALTLMCNGLSETQFKELEKPFVVGVTDTTGQDLVKLAEDFYKNTNLPAISAIFPILDKETQSKLRERAAEDKNAAMLSVMDWPVSLDIYD